MRPTPIAGTENDALAIRRPILPRHGLAVPGHFSTRHNRAWLGHVSLATTNVYAEVDLEMKAATLKNCAVEEKKSQPPWREDAGLMAFLRNL
jgi:hypothetical protein